MTIRIALFRGINVGGNNLLPMKELVAVLKECGLEEPKTYIQSGNVVFRGGVGSNRQVADHISAAVEISHGFKPNVIVMTAEDLTSAAAANPYPEAAADPKTLHLFFASDVVAHPDYDKLDSLQAASERFALKEAVFYLHAPDGIGRSKLVKGAEKALGVPVTARNWNTVQKLMEMASA